VAAIIWCYITTLLDEMARCQHRRLRVSLDKRWWRRLTTPMLAPTLAATRTAVTAGMELPSKQRCWQPHLIDQQPNCVGDKINSCHHLEQCDHYPWRHPSEQPLLGGLSLTATPTTPTASHNAVLATHHSQQIDRTLRGAEITANRSVGETGIVHPLDVHRDRGDNSQRADSTDDRNRQIVRAEDGSESCNHRHAQNGEFDAKNAVVRDTFSIDRAPSYWLIKRVEP
jgi:hypothetical protein